MRRWRSRGNLPSNNKKNPNYVSSEITGKNKIKTLPSSNIKHRATTQNGVKKILNNKNVAQKSISKIENEPRRLQILFTL